MSAIRPGWAPRRGAAHPPLPAGAVGSPRERRPPRRACRPLHRHRSPPRRPPDHRPLPLAPRHTSHAVPGCPSTTRHDGSPSRRATPVAITSSCSSPSSCSPWRRGPSTRWAASSSCSCSRGCCRSPWSRSCSGSAGRGMKRGLATGLTMLGMLLLFVGLGELFGQVFVSQLSQLGSQLPGAVTSAINWVNSHLPHELRHRADPVGPQPDPGQARRARGQVRRRHRRHLRLASSPSSSTP